MFEIAFHQLSDPEKMKPLKSPWKTKHPQTLWLLSRRGPRSPEANLNITLAQKWYHAIFQISAERSFPAEQEDSCTFLYNLGGCNLQKTCGKTSTTTFIQYGQKISFIKSGNLFYVGTVYVWAFIKLLISLKGYII